MPSQPPDPYSRQFNFTGHEQTLPTKPLPGSKVDLELNEVRESLNATISRLNEIQADDGSIRDAAISGILDQKVTAAESARNDAVSAKVEAVAAKDQSQVLFNNINGYGTSVLIQANSSQLAAFTSAQEAALSASSASDSYQQTQTLAGQITASGNTAAASAATAQSAAATATSSSSSAQGYANEAGTYRNQAAVHASNALASSNSAATSFQQAQNSSNSAGTHAFNAAQSAVDAEASAQAAETAAASVTGVTYTAPLQKVGSEVSIDLSSVAPVNHEHNISEITGLEPTLDSIYQYIDEADTFLLTQLAGKANTSHTHTASAITDFNTAVDARVRVVEVNDTQAGIRITQTGTGEAFRVEDSASPDSTPFVITADGRVGIGRSDPGSFILDVATGVVRFGGTLSVSGNGSSIPTLTVTAASNRTGPALTVTNEGTGASILVNDVASDTTPFIVDAGGNVGVKTASPSTDFEVDGNAKVTTLTIGTSTALTGVATDAEAIAGTSTSLAVTPHDIFRHLMSHRYRPIPIIGWTAAASGTGASAGQSVFYPALNGANAGVAGNARLTALIGNPSRGRSASIFDWSKAVACTVRCAPTVITDTAHTLMFSFGKNISWPGYGDLVAKGIAVKLVGSEITLQVHDGTTLTNVTASSTIATAGQSNDFLLYSDGAGNVELWHNDSVVATTTAGPTGNSPTNGFLLAVEVDSTSSSTTRLQSFIGCISFWHDC